IEKLGDRRRLHLGRLRGGAGAVLREHRRSFCRDAQKSGGPSRPPDGAPFVCAGAGGSAAVLQPIPTGEKADDRQSWPRGKPLRRWVDSRTGSVRESPIQAGSGYALDRDKFRLGRGCAGSCIVHLVFEIQAGRIYISSTLELLPLSC